MSHEETLGLIHGLAEVVRSQQQAQKHASESTAQQLQELSATVAQLSTHTARHPNASKLPNLQLPKFMGAEPLDRFLQQMQNVLTSSDVPPRLWLTYVKQQCFQDERAYDILCSMDDDKVHAPPFDAKDEDHLDWFNHCLRSLAAQRGIPKDQQIQTLLSQYYSIQQHRTESVADFSHCFTETQHALEKLIPGIHRPSPGNDTELIHAFVLKLRPDLFKDILCRDFHFDTLAALVEAAKRIEA